MTADANAQPITMSDYRSITTTRPLSDTLDTTRLFDVTHQEPNLSPIDQFIENNNAINVIWLGRQSITPELSSIVLLGYMSAVESYMRAIIRGLINIDLTSRKMVEAHQISFGAAVNHKKHILPDALLEEVSFVGADYIKKSINKYLGLSPNYVGMDKYFDEFEKICQLRHCCTHRFGMLGTKNALALGLDEHNQCLGKPLKLTNDNLEIAAEILRNFVKNLNNLIFSSVLERSVRGGKTSAGVPVQKIEWKWVYYQDKKIFSKYYYLFSSTKDSIPSIPLRDVYNRFLSAHQPRATRRASRTAAPAAAPAAPARAAPEAPAGDNG